MRMHSIISGNSFLTSSNVFIVLRGSAKLSPGPATAATLISLKNLFTSYILSTASSGESRLDVTPGLDSLGQS